jgi:hypothetical protein
MTNLEHNLNKELLYKVIVEFLALSGGSNNAILVILKLSTDGNSSCRLSWTALTAIIDDG